MEISHVLRDALKNAGLDDSPNLIISRKFIFGDEYYMVCGTVKSISYEPGEGICLYVTPPHIRNMGIIKIIRRNSQWFALGKDSDTKPGNFIWL